MIETPEAMKIVLDFNTYGRWPDSVLLATSSERPGNATNLGICTPGLATHNEYGGVRVGQQVVFFGSVQAPTLTVTLPLLSMLMIDSSVMFNGSLGDFAELYGPGNVYVTWGDSTADLVEVPNDEEINHTYAEVGIYAVTASVTFASSAALLTPSVTLDVQVPEL